MSISIQPTPTLNPNLPLNRGEFSTLSDALDYAARGETGMNFYTSRGDLADVLPYRDLRERAIAAARRFIALGLQPGDRVILLADTCASFIVHFFACQYAKLLPVPVAIPVIFGERQDYVSGLRAKLTDAKPAAAISPDNLATFLAEAGAGMSLKFLGAASDFDALPEADADPILWGADDLCYLQYSSGSTRAPAGIEITQKALMANVRAIATAGLDVREGDRAVSWLPLYHDMGLVGLVLAASCVQLTVDFLATRDFARRPVTWLKLISRNKGTLSYSPSFGYELCCRQATRISDEALDLRHWRAAGIGGDMVRPQILNDFAAAFEKYGFSEKAFVPSYGLAEATLALSFAKLDHGAGFHTVDRAALARGEVKILDESAPHEIARTLVGCGYAAPEHELEVRGEYGKPLPKDQIGRIFFKGPSLMAGYFEKPEETARIISEDGWLDTGDLGFFAEDGELVITGRAKDLILVNGRNVWPQDLEWAAESMPPLRRGDTAAISIDEGQSERVVMLVQARTSDPAAREALAQNVEATLKKAGVNDPMIRLVPPSSLPQTSSGKLSRAKAKLNFVSGVYGDPKGDWDACRRKEIADAENSA